MKSAHLGNEPLAIFNIVILLSAFVFIFRSVQKGFPLAALLQTSHTLWLQLDTVLNALWLFHENICDTLGEQLISGLLIRLSEGRQYSLASTIFTNSYNFFEKNVTFK